MLLGRMYPGTAGEAPAHIHGAEIAGRIYALPLHHSPSKPLISQNFFQKFCNLCQEFCKFEVFAVADRARIAREKFMV
jgi:hypothetical protein